MNIKIENFVLTICLALILPCSTFGQSKLEYGLGIYINHSQIDEDLRTQTGSIEEQYKGLRMPAVMTRIGYKMNDRFHINTGPGFSWFGSLHRNIPARMIASTFELPFQLEWNLHKHIHFSSGPVYNYIIGLSNQNDQMDFDMMDQVDSRHQMGFKHGIAVSYELIELSLSYSHYFTDVLNFALTDVNGNFLGSLVSRFRNIQLGIIIRR